MWQTSQGDRTLTGAEANLIREAVAYLRDMIVVAIDLDEPYQSDVALFNALQPTQQLAILHEVGFALLDPKTPMPKLTAIREATVYTLFRELVCLLEIEIDAAKLDDQACYDIRSMVVAACTENEDGWFDEDFGHESLDLDESFPPDVTCDQIQQWEETLEFLADQILWDRDFEMDSSLADQDPERSELTNRLLGIDTDYFSNAAPDLFADDYQRIDRELVALTAANRPNLN